MTDDHLDIWNLLDADELAIMFAGGMLPSELPAGFKNRRKRIVDAKAAEWRRLEKPKEKAVKAA